MRERERKKKRKRETERKKKRERGRRASAAPIRLRCVARGNEKLMESAALGSIFDILYSIQT